MLQYSFEQPEASSLKRWFGWKLAIHGYQLLTKWIVQHDNLLLLSQRWFYRGRITWTLEKHMIPKSPFDAAKKIATSFQECSGLYIRTKQHWANDATMVDGWAISSCSISCLAAYDCTGATGKQMVPVQSMYIDVGTKSVDRQAIDVSCESCVIKYRSDHPCMEYSSFFFF